MEAQNSRHPMINEPLWRRLWIYQSTRFPLFKTLILLIVFSAASISVSAHLGGRLLPGLWTFIVAWAVTLIIFFQMRACDEYKDLEDDLACRPERPIPSGLVSLELIIKIGLAGIPVSMALVYSLGAYILLPLILVWLWLFLMTAEFFAPSWLKARPLVYLLSHMAIMPLIDLFITSTEWLEYGPTPPHGLWLFLALSFINGSVIEIGRKVWIPENEIEGVDSYSALLGFERAAQAFMAVVGLSYVLLVGVGFAVGAPLTIGILGLVVLIVVYSSTLTYMRNPDSKGQERIDMLAGLWVFSCYTLAGFAPYIRYGIAS